MKWVDMEYRFEYIGVIYVSIWGQLYFEDRLQYNQYVCMRGEILERD